MEKRIEYNVVCTNCGRIFRPEIGSDIWDRAHAHAQKGYIDAIHVNGGEECGCVESPADPEAPYRVIGFDFEGHEFSLPFHSLFLAVRTMVRLDKDLCTVMFVDNIRSGIELLELRKRISKITGSAW